MELELGGTNKEEFCSNDVCGEEMFVLKYGLEKCA